MTSKLHNKSDGTVIKKQLKINIKNTDALLKQFSCKVQPE